MMTLDGSHGEGGGQLVRMACALSAITGRALHMSNVRARRDPPGLAPQHRAAVQAVAELCGADTEGVTLRSTEFVFRPGRTRGGEYRFDVGTAGSIALVLQALLPVALFAPGPVHLQVHGGTDVRAAPPLDYLRAVLLPLLARLGVRVTLAIRSRGYYPRGGGEALLTVQPGPLTGIQLDAPGTLTALGGALHVSNLPRHILERMERTACARLARYGTLSADIDLLGPDRAAGPGGAVVLWAQMTHTILGAAEVAQRGVPAEEIAARVARALAEELDSGVTLDRHAGDQLLTCLALAGSASVFTVRELTSHARTTAWLLEQFLPVRFAVREEPGRMRVEVMPR